MLVKIQGNGRGVTGLYIGPRNVRRFFLPKTFSIDLELDHVEIRCDLESDFWHENPAISDPRLCSWLEGKRRLACTRDILFMIPSGQYSYRLQAASPTTLDSAGDPVDVSRR